MIQNIINSFQKVLYKNLYILTLLILIYYLKYRKLDIDFAKILLLYILISTIFVSAIILYGKLNLYSGLGLLIFFLCFIIGQFKSSVENNVNTEESKKTLKINHIFLILIGIVALGYGSDIFIDSAINIASIFNVPTIVISVSLVAFGTSIPELVTSIVALKKGESGFVIGNILGSNIINLLLVLGTSLTINRIPITFSEVNILVYFLIATTLIFIFILFFQKSINKFHGILLLIIYSIFIYFQFSNIPKDIII